ncbi:C40 family peptidase [Micromonospora sp. C31]|uniref:NlpC/P60 family protein n=1 Tax=Micromonospora sp. C31 TaxID=2824876 RepID=UPI001B373E6A|nr:NlpC/P60 family protein [Micromonospora sp. C31]MBQ1073667.1 C40 family peptidase [Micromonospora sp. C31]
MTALRRVVAVAVIALLGLALPATAAHADYTFYRTSPHVGACWNKVNAYGGVYQVTNNLLNGTSGTHTVRVDVHRPGVGLMSSQTYSAAAGVWKSGAVANVGIYHNDAYRVYLNGTKILDLAAVGFPHYMQNCPTAMSPSTKVRLAISYGMAQLDALYVGCAAGTYRMGTVAPTTLYHNGTTCGQSRVYKQPAGTVGYDCSGLIYKMFQHAGVYFPWSSSSAMKSGVPQVAKSQIRVGDLLVKNGHVAMYLGDGDGDGVPSVLEATPKWQNPDGSWTGVVISDARPYLNSSSYTAHRVSGT